MPQLRVEGSPALYAAAVAALVRDVLAGATVELLPPDGQAGATGVRVSLPAAGRWLWLSAGRGPDQTVVQALSAGASAVLDLDASARDFERGLRALLSGEGFVPVETARWIAAQEVAPPRAPAFALTSRERDILRLVARGYSNNEIAGALTISTNTVRSHLHTLSVKLEATSRTRMLANARALSIAEAFECDTQPGHESERVSA